MKNFWTGVVLKKIILFTLPVSIMLSVAVYKQAHLLFSFILPTFVVSLALPVFDILTYLFPDFFASLNSGKQTKPTFSMIRSMKKAQKYDEALKELHRLADLYPQEVDIWIELLETALIDLKDKKQGESLYREAYSVLEKESKRQQVHRFYKNIVG
ncbi:MAG: hypothetical protein WBM02_03010 [bacterium]